MKSMKKLFAVLLAVALVMSLSVSVFADETVTTGTVINETKRTYAAYQIFSGTQADESAILGDIVWGDGINGDAFLAALKTDSRFVKGEKNIFADCTDADDVAVVLAAENDKSDVAKAFANVADEHKTGNGTPIASEETKTLNSGYYLIVETGHDNQGDDEATAVNPALLQVTNKDTISITEKVELPSVEKKVKDKNDSTGEESGWQDSADHDIGDVINYQLTGTLPGNFDDYETYKTYTFTDTLSAGLTYGDDATVYFVNGDAKVDAKDYFAVSFSEQVLTISLKTGVDLQAIDGVNNDTKIVVEYTAVLNENAAVGADGNDNTVKLEYSNNPNVDGEGTDKTPEDKVTVFTYELIINKVDENNAPLDGAGFTLYKKVAIEDDPDTTDVVESFDWVQIGDEVFGVKDDDGNFKFNWKGLDDGEYKLEETTTPKGYNTIAPIEFTITAEHELESDDPQLKNLETSFPEAGVNTTEGTITAAVQNNSGSTLPETGGMGTTIFYIVGGFMAVAAAVLLITKRRMSMSE